MPVQFIFAVKAHPHDKAGQDIITNIVRLSHKPEFVGKIIFVENYDMILSKKLISGCDLWLNMPTRPLEASGTSGEKAVMNGVLNFSVLDGWWAEGYVPGAGWAIKEEITYRDNRLQDELDASTLYSTLEEEIAPAFYNRNKENIPETWVAMMKKCFAEISPNYTMKRQLEDYYSKFYNKLEKRYLDISADDLKKTRQLIKWKEHVITEWDKLACRSIENHNHPNSTYYIGDKLSIEAALECGSLTPNDLKVELILVDNEHEGETKLIAKYPFEFLRKEGETNIFKCEVDAKKVGNWSYAIRVIPAHELLPHDLDFNLVKWF